MSTESTEPGLKQRVVEIRSQHQQLYGTEPTLIVRSPGRAEIIGNHVDYCSGAVLAGSIEQSTLVAISPSQKDTMIYSDGFSSSPQMIDLDAVTKVGFDPLSVEQDSWMQLSSSVLHQLSLAELQLTDFQATVSSTVTSSGGVSSSASFGVGLGLAVSQLCGGDFAAEELAKICQSAEHGVGSMCGLLDQYAVSLGEPGSLLLLDFKDNSARTIQGDLRGTSFVVMFDPTVRRNLAETGYLARRRACESGLEFINSVEGTSFSSLRSIDLETLERLRQQIESNPFDAGSGEVVYKRLRHVVTEIARVAEAVEALQSNNAVRFGELLTASGQSALQDYELDEGTPELTSLVSESLKAPGVLGVRNMGGGFSSVCLALVDNSKLDDFTKAVSEAYRAEFGAVLEFVQFSPSAGAAVI